MFIFCAIFSVGNFSLFAVFVFVTSNVLTEFVGEEDSMMVNLMKRLVSGIPDKIKFLVGSPILNSVPESSESLVVTDLSALYLELLMLVILNKRWQTLDLISMMEELNRSVNEKLNRSEWYSPSWQNLRAISVTDRLSSRPRFKTEEDLTDCA